MQYISKAELSLQKKDCSWIVTYANATGSLIKLFSPNINNINKWKNQREIRYSKTHGLFYLYYQSGIWDKICSLHKQSFHHESQGRYSWGGWLRDIFLAKSFYWQWFIYVILHSREQKLSDHPILANTKSDYLVGVVTGRFFHTKGIFSLLQLASNVWSDDLCVHTRFTCVQLCDPWTIIHQALLSMQFPRQEYWSGLPCPPPQYLPEPGIKLASLASFCIGRQILQHRATWEALSFSTMMTYHCGKKCMQV